MTKWYKLKRDESFDNKWSFISCDGCGEDIRRDDWFEIKITKEHKVKDCCSTICVGDFMNKYLKENKLNESPTFHIAIINIK